ncbi:MAG: hypothetical protein JST41_14180 [Bacteroidetes bacterium]|nr:hypothetical protein [Bacteroidota bacterium]MBX7129978.1 hypothetical protein [Flavobacteriales bacterium]HMU14139.1 hypothetical protein [Flavobacteriales bacterium]HNI05436.1 hypothetical protein [Flavobacteriales bacterium]HNK42775.1 hypothetical protein [Flavobacteriales bacterium]
MTKLLPLLLIATIPGTCSPDVDDNEGAESRLPSDSLEHWVMRDPPHLVDLVMLWAPSADSAMGHRPWSSIMADRSPVKWDRKGLVKWDHPRKDGRYRKGKVKCPFKNMKSETVKADVSLYLTGDANGLIEWRMGSGYSREWNGIGLASSFWSEVDSLRYEELGSCHQDGPGVNEQTTYKLNLPGKQPLWVEESSSCGTMGCDFSLTFSLVPFERRLPCD